MILIIDDNVGLAKLYQTILQSEGLESKIIHSGSEALDFLKENPAPKLVFLDCSMPMMSGEEFLDELDKLFPSFRDTTKIIGFSSFGPSAPLVENFQKRVFKYVEKPSDIDSFLKLVHSSL